MTEQTLSSVKNSQTRDDIYFVLLKEEYSVSDFETYIPGRWLSFYKYDIEYIGGQNKSLIIHCNEKLLQTKSLLTIIDSYSRVPLLARIDMSLLNQLSIAYNNMTDLDIIAEFSDEAGISSDSFTQLKVSSLEESIIDHLSIA